MGSNCWMDGWSDGWMVGWMDVRMDGQSVCGSMMIGR